MLNVSESTEQTVLEETGMGAAPAEGGSSGPAEAPVMREVENIAETVLDMDTVL